MSPSPFVRILIFCFLSTVGLLLFPKLQFNFLDQPVENSLSIHYIYPNAEPKQVEDILTTPIEAAVSLVPSVKKIHSKSNYGEGYVTALVDEEANFDFVRYQLSTKLRQIYPLLPVGIPFPTIKLNNKNNDEIHPVLMSYSIYAPKSVSEIYRFTKDYIAPLLNSIEEIDKIEVQGGNSQEWLVTYDPEVLKSLDADWREISKIIKASLKPNTLSYHDNYGDQIYLRVLPQELTDFENLIVDIKGKKVPFNQIASVKMTEALPIQYYRINGKNSVRLNLTPKSNANHLSFSNATSELVQSILGSLPIDYEVHLEYDKTEYVREELNKIKRRSMWTLGILMVLVVASYRKWEDSLIISVGLIMNLAISLIFYHLLSIKLNIYALAAITISFGIIIDNVIVLSHHYQKHCNYRIVRSLIAATLTTLSSLLLIFILPKNLQHELVEFSKVLTINLSVSLLVCVFVVPALIHLVRVDPPNILKKGMSFKRQFLILRINLIYNSVVYKLRKYRKTLLVSIILLFGTPVFLLPNKIEGLTWYNNSIGSSYYEDHLRPYIDRVLGGTLRLFYVYVYEQSGFRSPNQTELIVNCSLPEGTTIEQMNDVISSMETFLSQHINQLSTYIAHIKSGQRANIVISFPNEGNSNFPYDLKNQLQSFALNLGAANWNIYGVGKAFSNNNGNTPSKFTVVFKGYNKGHLDDFTHQFATILKEHPRIDEVDEDANINWMDRQEYHYNLAIDRELATYSNVNLADINMLLYPFNQDRQYISNDKNNVEIKMSVLDPYKMDLWRLNEYYQYLDSVPVRFNKIASISKNKMANSIYKEDQEYIQYLDFRYLGSARFGQKYLDLCLEAFKRSLPLGYSVSQGGYNIWRHKEKKKYGLLLIVIVSIFFICGIHFESLQAAGLVVLLIPISYIGVFLTFYCFDFPFDQGGYISFLLLSGVVVNAIIIILSDYYAFKNKYPFREPVSLYLRAFRNKSTPIFLSIFTTVLALVPFTFDGSEEVFWFALAAGTIGGLIFSIFVLLFIIPLFIQSR